MRIDSRLESSTVNGPGDRSVIWVNGCTLKCLGCWNEHTHAVDSSKNIGHEDIANWILDNAKDGVTFSGGEPIQQIAQLDLIAAIVKHRKPELSIGIYTGYTLKELEYGNFDYYDSMGTHFEHTQDGWTLIQQASWVSLRRKLDFAIMGRFNQQQLDTSRPYCSSKNQNIELFSERYTLNDFNSQEIEFQIDENGLIQITGFPVGLTSIQDLSAFEMREW